MLESEAGPGVRPLIIIGAGFIGRLLAEGLRGHRPTELVSARRLADSDVIKQLQPLLENGAAIVFAHGRNVNDPRFGAEYEAFLASRTAPLDIIAAKAAPVGPVVLVSSSVAGLDPSRVGTHSLIRLQHAFEGHFHRRFGSWQRCILRLGTVVEEGSQAVEGVRQLRRTFLIRRLRTRERTNLAWTDGALLLSAAEQALVAGWAGCRLVCHRKGLDLNVLLDRELGEGARLHIPNRLYALILSQLGVRPEFFLNDLNFLQANAASCPQISSETVPLPPLPLGYAPVRRMP